MVSGSRWMKSKMPWPPESMPVMKFDQATGLKGGTEVPSASPSDHQPACCQRSTPKKVAQTIGVQYFQQVLRT